MTPADQLMGRVSATQTKLRARPTTATALVDEASARFLEQHPTMHNGDPWPDSAWALAAATTLAQQLLECHRECLRIASGNHGQVGDLEWLLEGWQAGRLSDGDYIDAVREVFSLLQDHVSQLRAVVK